MMSALDPSNAGYISGVFSNILKPFYALSFHLCVAVFPVETKRLSMLRLSKRRKSKLHRMFSRAVGNTSNAEPFQKRQAKRATNVPQYCGHLDGGLRTCAGYLLCIWAVYEEGTPSVTERWLRSVM